LIIPPKNKVIYLTVHFILPNSSNGFKKIFKNLQKIMAYSEKQHVADQIEEKYITELELSKKVQSA